MGIRRHFTSPPQPATTHQIARFPNGPSPAAHRSSHMQAGRFTLPHLRRGLAPAHSKATPTHKAEVHTDSSATCSQRLCYSLRLVPSHLKLAHNRLGLGSLHDSTSNPRSLSRKHYCQILTSFINSTGQVLDSRTSLGLVAVVVVVVVVVQETPAWPDGSVDVNSWGRSLAGDAWASGPGTVA